MKKDVMIIGAGAAGLMCAIEAGKRGRSVLVLDHAGKAGKKIRVSGGGRCNFTNINISPDNYISCNPHFCKSAISRFTPHDIIRMLERHGIKYHEKEKGQLFCDEGAVKIINMLQNECQKADAEILLNCNVLKIKKEDFFIISTNRGTFMAESLVIATGGISYPVLGATDFGYNTARMFGLKIIPARPALVPLTFSLKDMKVFSELSGVSINGVVRCNKKKFQGNILFTHHGISGPAVLQISSYWKQGDAITINLLPGIDASELFMAKRQSRTEMHNLLSQYFPKRFSTKWCALHIQSKQLCQYTERELKNIAHQLQHWEIKPKGTEGYKKAEVTLGGVDTDELSSKTMETKKVLGLYFTGEVIDVTGQLGGYNLHWAWASGYAAGQYV